MSSTTPIFKLVGEKTNLVLPRVLSLGVDLNKTRMLCDARRHGGKKVLHQHGECPLLREFIRQVPFHAGTMNDILALPPEHPALQEPAIIVQAYSVDEGRYFDQPIDGLYQLAYHFFHNIRPFPYVLIGRQEWDKFLVPVQDVSQATSEIDPA